MSTLGRLVRTSHALTLAGAEEASRLGLREGDLEHLFLALVLSQDPAGQALRELGITIESAREAVRAEHAEQLAALGIDSALPEPGAIVPDASYRLEWNKRTSDLIARAGHGKRDGSTSAVLRELLAEPSGLVAALLARLGTTPTEVLAALDRARPPVDPPRRRSRGVTSASSEVFVPAPADDVVEFLTDPSRVPEWDAMVGSVELDGAAERTWHAHAARSRPDGRPVKNPPRRTRRVLELREADPERVAWRFTFPDDPRSRPLDIDLALAAEATGTRVTVTISWRSDEGWRGVLGALAWPVNRFFLWAKTAQVGAAISRTFRN